MTILTIPDVDPRLAERLRQRAARHGQSLEAEVRSILMASIEPEPTGQGLDLAEAIRRRLAPFGGVELPEHPSVALGDPPDFSP